MKDSVSEKITANEVMNNGRQVHLYYAPTMGEYQAYGYSAYIINHTNPSICNPPLERKAMLK